MILVTYMDLRTGEMDSDQFKSSAQMGIGQSAQRGMSHLYGKNWRRKYRILNVSPLDANGKPKEDDADGEEPENDTE